MNDNVMKMVVSAIREYSAVQMALKIYDTYDDRGVCNSPTWIMKDCYNDAREIIGLNTDE